MSATNPIFHTATVELHVPGPSAQMSALAYNLQYTAPLVTDLVEQNPPASTDCQLVRLQDRELVRANLYGRHPRDRALRVCTIGIGEGEEQAHSAARGAFDLALTEVLDSERHYFVVEVGSERGGDVLADVPHKAAADAERGAATKVHAQTAASMGRELDTTDIKGLLYRNYQHPRWDEVANRCLTCGNCTMVCPTCFCTTVEDVTDLEGEHVERHQRWDSCFTVDYSHIHGGSVRNSPRSRYRQWMTHKLATWWDQFGASGCVGCGRCITWCPVGIDLTEEARAIQETEARGNAND